MDVLNLIFNVLMIESTKFKKILFFLNFLTCALITCALRAQVNTTHPFYYRYYPYIQLTSLRTVAHWSLSWYFHPIFFYTLLSVEAILIFGLIRFDYY